MKDPDQHAVLYVYSLYSSEKENNYLQYTAALVIFYYLMQKGHFKNYTHELLVYDYKDSRRFMWEDKKFMNDINKIRSFDYLNRARVRTINYRDINAHQCTSKGAKYMMELGYSSSPEALAILKELSCKCGSLLQVRLDDDTPRLVCSSCKKQREVNGFLSDLHEKIEQDFDVAFL